MSQAQCYDAHQVCTCHPPAARLRPWDALIRSARHSTAWINSWIERSRQRQALQDLGEHLLKDIGVSRAAAAREAEKPFWM